MTKAQDLISQIETDQAVLTYQFKGFLVWPIVRTVVIQRIVDALNNLDQASSNSKLSLRQISLCFYQGLKGNPYLSQENDIMFFNSTLSNILTRAGYFNRISDYYWSLFEKEPLMVEEPFQYKHLWPRTHGNVYSRFLMMLSAELSYRFQPARELEEINKILVQLFELILGRLKNIDTPKLKGVLEKLQPTLVKIVAKSDKNYKIYRRFFCEKEAKVLFLEDGHYGNEKALIVKAAKDSGILVIEPQHGFVNSHHPAYNYGAGIRENRLFKKYYPDFYLTYGDFWTKEINIPNKALTIGNPYLTESLKGVHGKFSKEILFLGSGVTVRETKDLIKLLLVAAPRHGFRLKYRPHPMEKSLVFERYRAQIEKGLQIDDNSNLYDSLASCEVIIGELTTAIFEALLFSKPIFLYNSSYTQAYFSPNIKYYNIFDLTSFQKIFESGNVLHNSEKSNYYWEMDWKKNFLSFKSQFIDNL